MSSRDRTSELKEFFLNSLAGLYAVTAVFVLWRQPLILASVLAAGAVVMLSTRREEAEYVLFFSAGVLGTVAEVLAMASGAWKYTLPDLLGVPVWLPFLWGMAAIYILRLHEFIEKIER